MACLYGDRFSLEVARFFLEAAQTVYVFLHYSDILQRENMNADAIYVRGMCLYYDDSIDKAFQHFQQVLRLAPDHQKAKTTYRVSQKRLGTSFTSYGDKMCCRRRISFSQVAP